MKPTKKAIVNEKGYFFDPFQTFCKSFNNNRLYKDNKLTLCMVFSPDKKPIEYLLFKKNKVVYAHTRLEDVLIRADILIYLDKK